jgi:hypothetical protein
MQPSIFTCAVAHEVIADRIRFAEQQRAARAARPQRGRVRLALPALFARRAAVKTAA